MEAPSDTPSRTAPGPPKQPIPAADVLYIHPYNHMNDRQIPTGLIGLMNRVTTAKLGRYAAEVTPDEIRAARIVALDLHWFFSLDTVLGITRDIKQLNPDAHIIVGGITASFYAAHLMKRYPIDYLIQGDAEVAFPRLVEALLAGDQGSPIPNVHSRRGPPAAREAVTPEEYARTDYLTLDWFPTFAAYTREGHRRYAEQRFDQIDYYHPFIPLNRGCRFSCNFCFGAYQRTAFGPGQVDGSVQSLAARLDAIDRDPELGFVSLIAGTEDTDRFDSYRDAFATRRELGMNMMFCSLPRTDQLELIMDRFAYCTFDFTLPADIPLPLRAGGWSEADAEAHLLGLLFLVEQREDARASVSSLTRRDDPFLERLRREPLPRLNIKDNFEWNLPKPNLKTLPPPGPQGLAEGLERQAQQFTALSQRGERYMAARALVPALYPILDQPWLEDQHPGCRIEISQPDLLALREVYIAAYQRDCYLHVDELEAFLFLTPGPSPGSGTAPVVGEAGWKRAEADPVGQLEFQARYNGIHATWEGELPTSHAAAPAAQSRIVIAPTLVMGTAAVDVSGLPELPLWHINLPELRSTAGDGTWRIEIRITRFSSHLTVLHQQQEVLNHSWEFLDTRHDCPLFNIDLEGPGPDSPEVLLRTLSRGLLPDTSAVQRFADTLAERAASGRLSGWQCQVLRHDQSLCAWTCEHAQGGELMLFALPPDLEPGFAQSPAFDLVYRSASSESDDHPSRRDLFDLLTTLLDEVGA